MTKLNASELRDFGGICHYLTYEVPFAEGWAIQTVTYLSMEGDMLTLESDSNGEVSVVVDDE